MSDNDDSTKSKEGKVVGASGKREYADASIRETIISADLPSDDSRPEIPKPKKKD